MLTVSMLGAPCFSAHGTILRPELGRAGRMLACYLIHYIGRMHRREQLADMFWGETKQDRSRASLNTAVWRIRSMLNSAAPGGGSHLQTVDDEVMLRQYDLIEADTWKLKAASNQISAITGAISRDAEALAEEAVASYTAPFLDGEEADWVLHERERLHCQFVRTAHALMRVSACRGNLDRAIEYGRKILEADPFRESIQRDVMLLLCANGERVRALRAFTTLSSQLRTEMGIDPMPETVCLNERIHSGTLFETLDAALADHFGTAPP